MISSSDVVFPKATSQSILSRRMEVKYLVDRSTRTALARDLSAFMHPDAYAGPDGTYLVRSLYLDTPDYMAYHEKMAGTAARHKLRLRAYGEDPSQTPCVRLEVKSRYLNFIHKITVDIPRDEYPLVDFALRRRTLPPARLLTDPSISREFFRLQRQYNMEPKILLQYRRQAWERAEMSRIRVNFDDELVATRNLDLLGPLCGPHRLLQYGHSVFEIKVDEMMPYWMQMLIAKYELQNCAFSKYCYAVRGKGQLSAVARKEDDDP